MRGKMPAHETAKSVMASANRLMEVRHCWRRSRRIAEISVPAWPIPIHQTKLTMAKPQPTGMLMPHVPTPKTRVQAMPSWRACRRPKATRKPANQDRGVDPVRTMTLILSVTEAYVCPGVTIGSLCMPFPASGGVAMRSVLLQRRIGIPEPGQICRPRLGVQLGEQPVVQRVCLELGDAA